jgi:large subunit ribosomal protein L7e
MVASKKKSELALIPESVLKKRHDLDDLKRKRDAAALPTHRVKVGGKSKAFYVKKPEAFISQARSRRNNEIRYNRVSKKGMQKRASNKKETAVKELQDEDGQVTTVPYQTNSVGSNMVFAVRIRDHVGAPRLVKQALSRLRLREKNDGVFVRYDNSARKLLHLVEPWVVYGPPTKAVVEDLINRRGFGKVDGKRVPLSDNTVIEEHLGTNDMICVEDLVHELYNVGDNFKAAATFLWPFRLSELKTDFERRTLGVKDNKDYGDRGEAINEYIKHIL